MATQRVLAVCETCSEAYSARLVGGRVLLPTDDGCCTCEDQEFDVPIAAERR